MDDTLTHAQQLALYTAASIDAFRQQILSDDLLLCEVVAGGKFTWMREYFTRFRGLPVPADVGEQLYEHFCEQVRRRYNAGESDPKKVAGRILDRHEEATPPTAEELARSWHIDSAASDEGRRALYGDREPDAVLDEVMDRGRTVKPIVVRDIKGVDDDAA